MSVKDGPLSDDMHNEEFELYQVPAILLITVVSALGLPAITDSQTCNPVVKIQYNDNKFFTSQKTKTLKPIWNQTFSCIYKKENTGKLLLTVYDSNPFGRNTVIGDVEIILHDYYREARWFQINQRKSWSLLDIGRRIVTEDKYGSLGQLFLAVNVLNVNQEPVYVSYSPDARSELVDPSLVDVTCFPEVDLKDGETYNSRRDVADEDPECPNFDVENIDFNNGIARNIDVDFLSVQQESIGAQRKGFEKALLHETDAIEALDQLQIIVNSNLVEIECSEGVDNFQDNLQPEDDFGQYCRAWNYLQNRRQSAYMIPSSDLEGNDEIERGGGPLKSSEIKLSANENERAWELVRLRSEATSSSSASTSTSVKVVVRIRPSENAQENKSSVLRTAHGTDIICENKRSQIAHHYAFDYCFNSDAEDEYKDNSQSRIFEVLGVEILHHAWEGFNTCLFAYGQTGSGKSYSMLGTASDPGLIPRISSCLFYFIENHSNGNNITVDVSFLEIYNERIRDLLDSSRSDLKLREHPKTGVFVENLSKFRVSCLAEIDLCFSIGIKERVTASTLMNSQSSRSHAVFTLILNCESTDSGYTGISKHSKISLVDLAGSERSGSTGVTDIKLREGSNINKSLTTLGRCISALSQISSVSMSKRASSSPLPKFRVPYRDSVLTMLLKDCLSGNSKTVMLATVSPAFRNYSETLSTLRYAANASKIKTSPVITEDPTAKLIADLRAEINRLGEELSVVRSAANLSPVPPSKLLDETELGILNIDSKLPALEKNRLRSFIYPDCIDMKEEDVVVLSTTIFLDCRYKFRLPRGKEIIFGRHDGKFDGDLEADVLLQGPDVSPLHAKIIHDFDGRLSIMSLDALSLINVNGENVSRDLCHEQPLKIGDIVSLGMYFSFVLCVSN